MAPHIKSISVNGIRTLDQFTLDLDGLTVLIGENRSGKSLTTHSRRVLDELSHPAQSVAVPELEPEKLRTIVRRFDEAALGSWLEEYDGLGQLLDAGYQESFLAQYST